MALAPVPPVTRTLLIANVVVFGLQQIAWVTLVGTFALWSPGVHGPPGTPGFHVWQLVTYSFLHGSVPHLLFNMFALWMFGGDVEGLLGSRRYLTYYAVCVVGAAITQLLVLRGVAAVPAPVLGASGGVFGLLLAYGMAWPQRKLVMLFPPIPIPLPAWLLVTMYGLFELYLGVTQTSDGVAHFAHLGGMAAGFVLLTHWMRGARRR